METEWETKYPPPEEEEKRIIMREKFPNPADAGKKINAPSADKNKKSGPKELLAGGKGHISTTRNMLRND